MTKKIITHLHLRCYLLSAEISTCFMVLTILDKTTLTGNYKLPKNYCSIFKNLPARRSDFLQAHDFHELHLKRSTCYFFSLKLCGHCWLENSKSATRITEMGNLNCFNFGLLYLQKKHYSNTKISWIKHNPNYVTHL